MECVLQWLAQLELVACLTQALLARTDLPKNATLATHDSTSVQKMMTASCTLIIFVIQREILLSVDIVPHRNMNLFLLFFSALGKRRQGLRV